MIINNLLNSLVSHHESKNSREKRCLMNLIRRSILSNSQLSDSASKARIPKNKVSTFSGDDGLWSTPNDYMQLLNCLLHYGKWNGVEILKPETVKAMLINQIGDINMDSTGNYYNPAYCCNLKNFTSNTTSWGLAWAIDNQGKEHSLTTIKPVDRDAQTERVAVR